MKNKLSLSFIVLTVILAAHTVSASEVTGNLSTGVSSTVGNSVQGTVITAPTTNPASGTYTSPQNVTLSAADSTSIRYTTNGENPTCSTGTLYSGAISVSSTVTIRAIACYPENKSSTVSAHTFTINQTTTTTTTGGGGSGGGSSLRNSSSNTNTSDTSSNTSDNTTTTNFVTFTPTSNTQVEDGVAIPSDDEGDDIENSSVSNEGTLETVPVVANTLSATNPSQNQNTSNASNQTAALGDLGLDTSTIYWILGGLLLLLGIGYTLYVGFRREE